MTVRQAEPCENYFGNVCTGFGAPAVCLACGWERHEHPEEKSRAEELFARSGVALSYEWADSDSAVVEASLKGVTEFDRPRIEKIHRAQLTKNWARRAELIEQLRAVDRAIMLREACLERLGKIS